MNDHVTPQDQHYAQVLDDYTSALKHGDIETVAAILHDAEQDHALEQMLLVANITYQKDTRITIRSAEVKQANVVLLNAFSSHEHEHTNTRKDRKKPMHIHQEKPLLIYPSTRTRFRRFNALAQTLVAVFIVGLLVSGFALLFASRHQTTTSSGLLGNSHTVLSRSTVVASTDDGTVYAMRPDTGAIAWHYATGKSTVNGSSILTVQGQVVYFANNGQLYALHVTNGTLLWHKDLTFPGSKDFQNSYTKIIVEQGIVFVSGLVQGIGLPGGSLYALRERDGVVLWHYWCDTNSLLAVHNGVVYVQKSVNVENLQALRVSDGSVLWSYKTPVMAVVADNKTVYVYSAHVQVAGDMGGNKKYKMLHALSTKGVLLWSKQVVDDGINSLVMAQGVLIVGEINGKTYHVCAYRTANGFQSWCTPNEVAPFAANTNSYAVLNNTLYSSSPIMSSSSNTLRIDANNGSDGSLRWSIHIAENFALGVLVAMDKTVYVVGNHKIYALDSDSGRTRWQLLNNKNTFTAIAVGSW